MLKTYTELFTRLYSNNKVENSKNCNAFGDVDIESHSFGKPARNGYYSVLYQVKPRNRQTSILSIPRTKLVTLLYVLMWFVATSSVAQISPVEAQIQVQPPYSIYLSDYTSPASQRLRLSLLLLDVNKSDLEVGLRFTLEAPGVRFTTSPDFRGEPFYLSGGEQLILEGYELAQYFQPENMVFQGVDVGQFIRNGTRLPEGFYRFSVEVYEYMRPGKVISRPNFTTVWISLGNPPLLSLPLCGSTVAQDVNMPSIVFSWNQFGTVPVGGGLQNYNFELFEVLPRDVNPEEVVRTQLPVYSEEVIGTQLIYDISKPTLFEGQQYVWRVQAFDPTGQVYYKNDGYSAICTFNIPEKGQEAGSDDFFAQGISQNLGEVIWSHQGEKYYAVAYRKAGDPTYPFHTDTVQGPRHIIRGLEPGTTYEVKIAGQTSGNSYGNYIGPATFRTYDYEPYACKEGPTTFEPPANSEPLPMLMPGDIITAAGFDITVAQAVGGMGQFSGKGITYIPWMGMRLAVAFDRIGLNTDKQLTRGEIRFAQDIDVESLLHSLPEPSAIDTDITLTFEVGDADQMTLVVTGNEVTITGPEGQVYTFTVEHPEEGFTIEDDAGNVFVATPDNKGGYTVNKVGQTDTNQTAWHKDVAKQLNTLDNKNRVTFGNAGKYAFDEYDKAYENSPYAKEYEILNDDYYVPWKLIPKGKSDQVSATLAGDFDPEKVIFKNTTGTVFNASRKGKTFEIDLVAASGAEGYELFAIYQESDSVTKSLGKLKVTSYPLATHKVKIVPMQASTIDAGKIREGLDAIYNKYGVRWEVEVLEPFIDTDWDEGETGLQTSGSGFFSEYTPEMRALNAAFDQVFGFDETSAYLFYFDQPSENNDLAGDMPVASQVGYIFSQSLDDKTVHTIAHELGHGVFHLKHPFSYDNNLKNATTNLMDYSGHEKLVKYQWDQVFKPKPVLFPEMQGEDEGVYIYEFLGKKYETLFDKVYSKNFTLNTEYYDKIQGGETNNFAPEFTDDELKEFSEEEKTWIKKWEVRARKSNDVLLDVIDAIQKASAGEKISKIIAQQDKVYIVKCNFDDYDFNVAIYGNGDGTTLNKIFTKVVVGKLEDLSLEENQKHLYVDVNEGRNYWIMALFEDEKKEPSLIVQISGKYNVLKAEKWLAFLNIINPKLTTLDKDPSFDWMEDVDLDDDISEEDLANIIENRNSVNDRTDKSIYGDDAMRSVTYNGRTGYMYKGEDKAEPEISGETEFEKEVKREIYNEIISEGGFSSVNTYDGEIFTWGKGFAINGQLKDVLKDMYENADFKQILA
jgi:hypothetical protein